MREEGILPGGLNVRRRAKKLREALEERERNHNADALIAMDWINVWALAVNEENAAGGKVVTAPTNGAAGLVPAVLRYYDRYCKGTAEGRHTFLLTAAAICSLYKRNASISAQLLPAGIMQEWGSGKALADEIAREYQAVKDLLGAASRTAK